MGLKIPEGVYLKGVALSNGGWLLIGKKFPGRLKAVSEMHTVTLAASY